MNVQEAITAAKRSANELFADEEITSLRLEEVEHDPDGTKWAITLSISRVWTEGKAKRRKGSADLVASLSSERSYKIITIAEDGTIISMKVRKTVNIVGC